MSQDASTKQVVNSHEKRDAKRREAPSAAVVYEAIRAEAETELTRPMIGLGWSALAAGLSMGFSLIAQALLYSYTPDAEWTPIVSSFGYSIGFLFVILGRQQLFTENTLTPVLEVLRVRSMSVVGKTLNLWLVVLLCNMVGVAIFAFALSYFDVLDPKIDEALKTISTREYGHPFGTVFVRAIFAGWLVALMLWLMPFAESARVGVIILVSYVIGLAHFPHIIAGSVAAIYAVFNSSHSFLEFLFGFFTPTLLGNTIGGVMMVAAVNYAQVAYSSNGDKEKSNAEASSSGNKRSSDGSSL
ncbi:formate/nitrite transporter family protein [Marinobacter nanhaiticus D15-8W]|uniref:Formate/nitrite transporter family protein n=1 Tax=Marinobacter nanhaiticus D15-8W TaxID=626887 RepID=N6W3W8_9GAMM|nr:formate/nitrite transporter family protein [Marinobacter nanhaiticus]ENO14834.1 formate/nitrite transporter family protein [Marinobacter nanhaiticus D15-8W]BES69474.1 formate/nitrite transporter family protein [Marinobacter nanhaiticus D15-8W]